MQFCQFWPTLQTYFWPIPGHKCRSKKIFGREKDCCLKSEVPFCVTFANKFSPIKNPFLGMTSTKKIYVFFCKRWPPFFEVKQRWVTFLPGFSGILLGFQLIKTFGLCFEPQHPCLLYHCPLKIHFWPLFENIFPAPMFRGTCSSTEMSKRYMARESLGTPGLERWRFMVEPDVFVMLWKVFSTLICAVFSSMLFLIFRNFCVWINDYIITLITILYILIYCL